MPLFCCSFTSQMPILNKQNFRASKSQLGKVGKNLNFLESRKKMALDIKFRFYLEKFVSNTFQTSFLVFAEQKLFYIDRVLFSTPYTVHTVQYSTPYTLHSTVHRTHCTVQYTVHTLQYSTPYTLYSAVHRSHCAV